MRLIVLTLLAALPACALISTDDYNARMDLDGDGVARPTDCDDNDATVGLPVDYYGDADGDGFGHGEPNPSCTALAGYVADNTDCDDTLATVNPAAPELCNGIDDNCDGHTDENTAADAPTWHADADGDGYGDPSQPLVTCYQLVGYVLDATDCNDADASINPAATEICDGAAVDEDCSGSADIDCDADGYANAALGGDDCDDTNAAVNPGENEVCGNAIDDNCDGVVAGSCAFSGDVDLADATIVVSGTTGYSVGTKIVAGDVTGDGFTDIALWAGAARILSGPINAPVSVSDADPTVTQHSGQPTFNGSMAVADVDGDGVADLCLGAITGVSEGDVYAYYGPMTATRDQEEGSILGGGDALGHTLVAAGDMDGDGDQDLLSGASASAGDYHEVIYGGARDGSHPTATVTAERGWQGDGPADAGGGDVDGDGLDDILVGETSGSSPANSAAYLVLGPVTGTSSLADADAKLTGEYYTGWSVAIPGDTNADGYDDILIAAWGANVDNGNNYLMDGPLVGAHDLSSDATADLVGEVKMGTGYVVASAGDVDGNGTSDLLTSGFDSTANKVYVVLTPVSGTVDLAAADGRLYGGDVGYYTPALTPLGDMDQDGYDDFAIGAPAALSGDGAVYLIFGGAD